MILNNSFDFISRKEKNLKWFINAACEIKHLKIEWNDKIKGIQEKWCIERVFESENQVTKTFQPSCTSSIYPQPRSFAIHIF